MATQQSKDNARAKLSKDEFLKRLSVISTATSVEDNVLYCDIQIHEQTISGTRYHPTEANSFFSIKIDELYQAYLMRDEHNTSTLKKYISDWAQSPALAILLEAGLTRYADPKKH